MKEKNIFTHVLNKIANTNFWLLFRSYAFLLALLSLVINLSCENSDKNGLKSKTNSPPIITSVAISPGQPNKRTKLNLFIQSHDPDGDSVTYHYQWLKNDEEILGENSSTLKCGNLGKGDLIRARVTPSDGKVNGTPFLSAPVRILNSPPIIQGVWIEPNVAYVTDPLKANLKSSDLDGDFVYYTYQWEKNGMILTEEKKEILERGPFRKGDSIAVTVTPNDGESMGMAKRSGPIMISKSPLIIVSSPLSKTDGSIYTYQVRTNHSNDDPIIFTLKTAPNGMEINKETGLIRWEIHKWDLGTQPVEIEASDSEGVKCIQRYTLSVDFR